MELRDMEIFEAVARNRSISAAALELRMAQPSVSARVQRLERELGALLLKRTRRGVELTEAGFRFLTYAERCLSLAAEAREVLADPPSAARLRLSAPPSVAELWFPIVLPKLVEAGVEVWTYTDHSPRVMQQLLDDRIDAGICLAGPTVPGIAVRPVRRIPVVGVCRADHPLAAADGERVTVERLVQERLAVYSFGEGANDLRDRLRATGWRGPYAKVTPAEVARRLVLDQNVISFLPETIVRRDLDRSRMKRLAVEGLPDYAWDVVVIYRERKNLDPSLELLFHLLGAGGRHDRPALR